MSRFTVAVCLPAAALMLGTASVAVAQGMPAGMADTLNRKYDILQQQADTERMRAETERAQTESRRANAGAASFAPVQSAPTYYQPMLISASGDPLAGTDAVTYRLRNGVIMRFSGILWPSPEVICIAYC